MAVVIVTKPGVLTAKDKAALRKSGVVPIEASDPSEVRLLQVEGPALAGDDLFWAAMQGLNSNYPKSGFADAVAKLANERFASRRAGGEG